MAIQDLVTDVNGQLSHSKIWANLAYAAATYKFVTLAEPSADIWWAYLAIVGGSALASKFISYKFGGAQDAK